MGDIVPGELRNVDVQFISLVDKGANGRKFKIFKSADAQDDEHEEDEARGLFQVLKDYFTRRKEKAEQQVEVEKIGRKIAASRLKILREAYEAIGRVLAEVEDEGKEETEVTREEVAKLVGEEIQKALGPVIQRVEKLESPEKPKEEPKQEELTKEDIAKLVGDEIQKALQPVVARLEKVEQVRGPGNAVQPETAVQKSAPDWGGIFLS